MREYLQEWREHWDDAYWRADHQVELAVLATVLSGLVLLAFKYAELRMTKAVIPDA